MENEYFLYAYNNPKIYFFFDFIKEKWCHGVTKAIPAK